MTQHSLAWKAAPAEFDRNLPVLAIRSKSELIEVGMQAFMGVESGRRQVADPAHLRKFIREVSRHYHTNPYHNFHHAVDTTNMMAWLLTRPAMEKNLPDPYPFALLVAALIHDLDHPGTDNQWEVKTKSPLARKYRNLAVLENHSLDRGIWLLQNECPELLAHISPAERDFIFYLLEITIIATDFSQHLTFLDELESYLIRQSIDYADPAGLSLAARTLIKAADISNTAKVFSGARLWGKRVMREYWAQGRLELSRNLPLGPLNDENLVDFPSAQAWFIEHQVLKLFELLTQMESEVQVAVDALYLNLERYTKFGSQTPR